MKFTTLDDTLEQIARDFGLDADRLKKYAAEDEVGGWDGGEGKWPCGSLWSVEGKVLYALVRMEKPINVCELGAMYGASTTHLADALRKNKLGKVTAVDNLLNGQKPKKQTRVHNVKMDGVEFMTMTEDTWDFIFEDLMHSKQMCHDIAVLAQEKLTLGGFLVVHDALHFIVGADVQAGLESAGLKPRYYLTEPSDCGLAIWRKAVADG